MLHSYTPGSWRARLADALIRAGEEGLTRHEINRTFPKLVRPTRDSTLHQLALDGKVCQHGTRLRRVGHGRAEGGPMEQIVFIWHTFKPVEGADLQSFWRPHV